VEQLANIPKFLGAAARLEALEPAVVEATGLNWRRTSG
jgi:hypothetical protein